MEDVDEVARQFGSLQMESVEEDCVTTRADIPERHGEM